nr:MAG TPA_asm: hypothetical protein [Caudoviricetes sp.]
MQMILLFWCGGELEATQKLATDRFATETLTCAQNFNDNRTQRLLLGR